MTYSGAFSTPLSGLSAAQSALSTISNNISNSQTVGYRGVDTSFSDLVNSATATSYSGGGVRSSTTYSNSVQGSISNTSVTTNAAISGNSFFVVSEATSATSSSTSFSDTTYYTRAGDFSLNNQNYLVNSSGYYAEGYALDSSGNTSGSLTQIQIASTVAPTASTEITYEANLPASASSGDTFTSTADVYDSLGQSHTVTLTWTKGSTDSSGNTTWTLDAGTSGSASSDLISGATVIFDSSGNLTSINGTSGSTSISMTADFSSSGASNSQSISLNFGSSGLTQTTGDSITENSITTDGYTSGTLSSVSVGSDGTLTATYSNGQEVSSWKLGLALFSNADGLQAQSGQAYTATTTSGSATYNSSSDSSAFGTITGSAVEGSNSDISDEFTKMISVERYYSANAKVLTTVDEMLQEILAAKR